MMKKSFFAVLLAALIGYAPAQASEPIRFGLGAHVGWIRFQENSYEEDGRILDMDPSPVYEISGAFFLSRDTAVSLGVSNFQDADGDAFGPDLPPGTDINATNIAATSIRLSVRRYFRSWRKLRPYAGGGIDYHFNTIDKESFLSSMYREMKLDNNWGWHLDIGVERPIVGRLSGCLGFRYVDSRTDLNWTLAATGESGSSAFRMNRCILSAGLRYDFF